MGGWIYPSEDEGTEGGGLGVGKHTRKGLRQYSLTFTCKVPECDEHASHMVSKRAYQHGICSKQ